MKKLLTVTLALMIGATAVSAQYYKQAVGLRLGYDFSVTYKYNLSPKNFIDAYVSIAPFGGTSVYLYGSYNWNWEMHGVPGLSFYCGPGAGLGTYLLEHFALSVNANLGLEYSFLAEFDVPIALSLDFSPGLGLSFGSEVYTYFGGSYGGLGVKYTF